MMVLCGQSDFDVVIKIEAMEEQMLLLSLAMLPIVADAAAMEGGWECKLYPQPPSLLAMQSPKSYFDLRFVRVGSSVIEQNGIQTESKIYGRSLTSSEIAKYTYTILAEDSRGAILQHYRFGSIINVETISIDNVTKNSVRTATTTSVPKNSTVDVGSCSLF